MAVPIRDVTAGQSIKPPDLFYELLPKVRKPVSLSYNMSQAEVYDAEPTSLFGIGRFFSPPFRLITPVFLSTSSFSYYEGLTNPIFLSLCFTTCL